MNTLKQKKKAPRLDFWSFPSVKSITVNKHMIRNFKLKGLGLGKVPIRWKNDLRVFCEKLPFDSLFSSES